MSPVADCPSQESSATLRWSRDALSAVVDFASLDFGEGSPEEILEPLVKTLVAAPFAYTGAAVYQDDAEGWTRIAAAGRIAKPALPAGETEADFTLAGQDLRLLLDGGGGGRILVLRRREHELQTAEREVLERLIQLVDNLLDQHTYTHLLTLSERHYRHIYSHANLGIFFSRVGQGLQRANPGLLAMLGYATEREMRESIADQYHTRFYDPPEDRLRLLQQVTAEGAVRDFHTRMRHADGSLLPVSVTACLVQDPDRQGEDPEFFGFVTDLTAQDETEEARRGQQRAETANLNKNRFLAAISHELRTPLNGVLGMVDLLATGILDDEQTEAVTVIQQSSGRLLELLDRILDYTSLEAGALKLNTAPFRPVDLVTQARARWLELAASRGLNLDLRIQDGLPSRVLGDAQRCAQILDLLLDNALRYTPTGGHVEIQVAPEGEAILLVVTDTGCGLASDRLEQILSGEAQDTRRDDLAGAGLGLAMVQSLVDLMDGRLWADSVPGQGSRFAVLLPLPRPVSQSGDQAEAAPQPDALRVLVVEDNPVNQLVARKLLESLDLDVTVAPGGREALAEVRRTVFDLVFMDLQMPDLDGFETTRALRSEVSYSGPVVAMTAHATEFHRDKCRRTGMNGFVTKPLERKRLADFLDSLPPREAEPGHWLWLEPADNRPLAAGD